MIRVWLQSILFGWAVLLAITYGIERPVLSWTMPLFGPMWIATIHLMFDAVSLTAAGWVAGRRNRSHAVTTGLVFAATLCFFDFGTVIALNVPWLVRLAWNSFHDSRYLDSLISMAESHVLLFGCLITGARLGRPREKPVSIA